MRELFIAFDSRCARHQPEDLNAQNGLVGVRTQLVISFCTLGPAALGVEPVYTVIQKFSGVANYHVCHLDDISRFII